MGAPMGGLRPLELPPRNREVCGRLGENDFLNIGKTHLNQ